MPDLNMKYLRTFLVFVEEKSTAKTGERLGIHQNNVIGHVSKVEEAFGKPLFQRRLPPNQAEQRGRAQLTEAGLAFLPKAIAVMRSHDQMLGITEIDWGSPEIDRAIAADLLKMASDALKHDLPDDDRIRIYTILKS